MVKRNEFKQHSRYLAMLMAASLAFSNTGAGPTMAYAAEAQAEDSGAGISAEGAGGSGGEDSQKDGEAEAGGSGATDTDGRDSEGDAASGKDANESGAGESGGNASDEQNGEAGEKDADSKDTDGKETSGSDADGKDTASKDSEGDADSGKDAGESGAGESDGNASDTKDGESGIEDAVDKESGKAAGSEEDADESENKNADEKEDDKDSENDTVDDSKADADGENESGTGGAGDESTQAGQKAATLESTETGAKAADVEEQKTSYELTYVVDPEEGAVVKGPSSVKNDETAIFTVEAKEGYVIKDVYSLAAEVSPADEMEIASASNAQPVSEEQDGEHFQTYQIEDVTDDAEIIIELEQEGIATYSILNADAVVTPDMTAEQIQEVIDDEKNSIIAFGKGEYQNMGLIIPAGRSITIVPEEEVKFVYTNPRNAFEVMEGSSLVFGNGLEAVLEIEGAVNGIYGYQNGGNVNITIAENMTLYVHDSVKEENDDKTGHGISLNGEVYYRLEAKENASIILRENRSGLYTCGANSQDDNYDGSLNAAFAGCALIDFSDNQDGSGIHQGAGYSMNADILFEDCQSIKLNGNGTDAICLNTGAKKLNVKIQDCPFVEMKENGSWGINGGDIEILGSNIDISNNSDNPWARVTYTSSNLYAESLRVENSVLTANHCGANSGVWVEFSARIKNSTIYANQNGLKCYGNYNNSDRPYYCGDYPWNTGNGLAFCGAETEILNSVIYAQENGGSGVAFASKASDGNIQITSSEIYADRNGVSENIGVAAENVKNTMVEKHDAIYYAGIAVIQGDVKVEDSIISAIENKKYGIAYHDLYHANMIQDGKTVAVVKVEDAATGCEIRTADFTSARQNTIILNGSLQGIRDYMTGSYTMNGVKQETEIYVAPVNQYGTKLTRFNLQESNLEVGNAQKQIFNYYDPNKQEQVTYSFRYNTAEEDLTGTGGHAYVWAPVSILHYDATQGSIRDFGTAQQGNAALMNTRGDGSAVGNAGNAAESANRYATDYTIFGNSMNLTEGELPEAVRAGYKFAGWYVADDEQTAKNYAAAGNWDALNKLLNTRFTADSKVSEDITDVSKGQEEKTIYAKWVLPNQYNIVIHYVDERTGANIRASYNSDYMEEGSSYDVETLLKQAITGYTWIRYEGGASIGSLNSDLVFTVYYNRNSTSNRGGGSGDGGGSHRSTGGSSENAGPGVTIPDTDVPLAELPVVPAPDGLAVIPDEEVPLAGLPKTGQKSANEMTLLISALLLGAAGIFRKRSKDEQE